jgi:ATP-dependent Clp protease ATP-binding subunit ClpA
MKNSPSKTSKTPTNAVNYIIPDETANKFVKIKALTLAEFTAYYEMLLMLVKEDTLKTYVDYVTRICDDLVIRTGKEKIDEAIYHEICEIYPALAVETFAMTYNHRERTSLFAEAKSAQKETKTKKKNSKFFESLVTVLNQNVIGQAEALTEITDLLKLKATDFSPMISALFVGSTGIGKTETAKMVAKYFLDDPERIYIVNCGEYATAHEQNKLLGSPPGYIGHDEKSFISTLSEKSNEWVIVFDEFEKASERLQQLLLGILDSGKITDNKSATHDFTKSIFIFTSNIGVKDMLDKKNKKEIGFVKNANEVNGREVIDEAIKKDFAPELINRFDKIIHFRQLSKEDAFAIAKLHLEKELPTSVNIDSDLIDYVVENSYSEEYGARNIRRFIKNNVCLKLAEYSLEKKLPAKTKSMIPLYENKKLLGFNVSGS